MRKPIDAFISERVAIIPNLQGEVSQGALYNQYRDYCEKRSVEPEPYESVSLVLATHVVGLQSWWSGTVHHTVLTGIVRFVDASLEVACERK